MVGKPGNRVGGVRLVRALSWPLVSADDAPRSPLPESLKRDV